MLALLWTSLLLLQPEPEPGGRAREPVEIHVSERGDVCIVRITGETFRLARGREAVLDDRRLESRMRALAAQGAVGLITAFSAENVSYRCLGSIIFLTQQAGLRAGFISQPAPQPE